MTRFLDALRKDGVTIRAGSLEALDVDRDHTLPLMDYFGGWRRPNGDER